MFVEVLCLSCLEHTSCIFTLLYSHKYKHNRMALCSCCKTICDIISTEWIWGTSGWQFILDLGNSVWQSNSNSKASQTFQSFRLYQTLAVLLSLCRYTDALFSVPFKHPTQFTKIISPQGDFFSKQNFWALIGEEPKYSQKASFLQWSFWFSIIGVNNMT